MQIEDTELRDIFKTESEERLQKLDEGLLLLEKNPQDPDVLSEIFREAHSLKGAGRMVGLQNLETIAHRFEDALGKAKRGELTLAPDIIDRLYQGLDAIRSLAHEAITGESPAIDADYILTVLDMEHGSPPTTAFDEATDAAEPTEPRPSSPNEPESDQKDQQIITLPDHNPTALESLQGAEASPAPTTRSETVSHDKRRYRVETIRVKPEKLDALMTQAGELTVTKIRIAQRTSQIDEILELWDEINRDMGMYFVRSAATAKTDACKGIVANIRADFDSLGNQLNQLKTEATEDLARLDMIAANMEEGIRSVRLLPLSTVFKLFPRMVRDLARAQAKEIELQIEGGDATADKRILEDIKDPLMHLLRNAVDHGVETVDQRRRSGKTLPAIIRLRAYQTASEVVIEVADDGLGLDLEAIRRQARQRKIRHEDDLAAMTPEQIQSLIFSSGFSTSSYVTDVSGRGVGLDVVRNNVVNLKGSIQVFSEPGQGCRFLMRFPITLATTRVLIVAVDGYKHGLPVEFVHTTLRLYTDTIFSIEGRQTITFDQHPISVARFSDLLERRAAEAEIEKGRVDSKSKKKDHRPCIIIAFGEEKLGLVVDELVDEQEIVLKPFGGLLKRVRNVSGAAILGTGEVCMVLNPADLIQSVQRRAHIGAFEERAEESRQPVILLVEDSITTRTQEKRILEGAGYEVVTAVDGLDALNCLSRQHFDAVVSDIEMPRMNGLKLCAKIREDRQYSEMPVILVTSLTTEEDQQRGIAVGANAYITKGGFEQEVLLDTLERLV